MRMAHTVLAVLVLAGCGTLPAPRHAPLSPGPPADNECAVDIFNGQDVPMSISLQSRAANELGTLEPSRTFRYAEECTPRTWTITGVPRSVPVSKPEDEARSSGSVRARIEPPGVVTQSVEVRPGVVVRVVL